MKSRQAVVDLLYQINLDQDDAVWQLTNRLANLQPHDLFVTVRLLTHENVSDRNAAFASLRNHSKDLVQYLGKYPLYEEGPQLFRIFVDAIVRANNNVANALQK